MGSSTIFLPMGALALLTFTMLIVLARRRFRAGHAGFVTYKDFMYGDAANVPEDARLANRNYINLFEIPMLFYVICMMLYVTGRAGAVFLVLAWAYVVLRALHSYVHVTSNHIRTRFRLFAASNIVLMGMWAGFFIALFMSGTV